MSSSISALGVILAAVSAFPIGSLWYSPTFFLKPWMKMTGTSDADMKKNFPKAMGMMLVAAVLAAYVLAYFMDATGKLGISGGLEIALWSWVGISVTTIITSAAFESRDSKVMVITAGNRLVTLLVMGLILGLFMK